ncbi:hypothetical protein KEM52_001404 [Ascosphaera acerosa]|nr:hypothetical protein KEM52_001404 [Ascosphaera acerosa]
MASAGAMFTAPAQTLTFDGLLFDFDGTIVDSTDAVEMFWHRIAKERGMKAEDILHYSHGRRSIEVLRTVWPEAATQETDGSPRMAEASELEGSIPRDFGENCVILPGAAALLARMTAAACPWAVVTSGTYALASGWIGKLRLAPPKTMVVAEDVAHGKPHPMPYLMGRDRLGLPASARVCVFEDAPSGIESGKRAGMTVVALATTHPIERLKQAGADYIVRNLESVVFQGYADGKVTLEVRDALVEGEGEGEGESAAQEN